MNFTIEKEILMRYLSILSKGLPAKTPLPILNGIKFNVKEDKIKAVTSNSDLAIEINIDDSSLTIDEPGQFVVIGSYFIEIIRQLNSRRINFYLEEDTLVIKPERGEYKLITMNPLDYPKIEFINKDNPLIINSEIIKKIVKETAFAASTSEKKPTLTGINLTNQNNNLEALATDSFRLAKKVISIPEYEKFNIVVPAKSLNELAKIIDDYDGDIALNFSNNRLLATFKNIKFQTSLIDGNFPDTSRLINSDYPIQIRLNKDELFEVVERVSVLSPKDKEKDKEITYSIIKFELKADRIVEISSNNGILGSCKDPIYPTDIIANGPITIGFSSRYLKEALKSFNSTEITINLINEIRPFIITGDNDPNLVQLIMPVRMNN